ncbi:HutD family protein [Fulvivirga sp.]|uniref:HutD/Ves family protein n=1 Tax=Fulvivirga sp. TaxID=1931237 RepID=UPI0032EBF5AE
MDIKTITPSDYKKTVWSGGTTTQLYIYPTQKEFKANNYDFRLSIASVEIEESIFTKLPSVNRTLMVLDGEITLTHESHHEKNLKKFESDQFLGDWTTKCLGTCTDFNLMTKGETSGTLTPITFEGSKGLKLSASKQFTFFYLNKGMATIKIDDNKHQLNQSELMVIREPHESEITISSYGLTEIIQIDIK